MDGLPVDAKGNLWLGDENGFLLLAAVLTATDVQPVMSMSEMQTARIDFLAKAYNMNAAAIHSRKDAENEADNGPSDDAGLDLAALMGSL